MPQLFCQPFIEHIFTTQNAIPIFHIATPQKIFAALFTSTDYRCCGNSVVFLTVLHIIQNGYMQVIYIYSYIPVNKKKQRNTLYVRPSCI